MKKLRPEYYHSRVRFNAVSDARKSFFHFNEFATDEEIFDKGKILLNYITEQYSDEKTDIDDNFYSERAYEFFKVLLAKMGEISQDKASPILSKRLVEMYYRCFQNIGIEQTHIPQKFHHGGPCIPGVWRIFVDINGRLFPCERVSEASETVIMGSIDEGVSLEKAAKILNPERVTHERCKDCWVYRQCYMCVVMADDMREVSDVEAQKRCPNICASVETLYKDFCILRELGYTFNEERFYYF
jgi:uncharacterized protein